MKINRNYYTTLIKKYNEELQEYVEVPIFKISNNENNTLTTISYLHRGIDFSKKENRIARGLVVDNDDNVVLVGYEKFFCLNQLDTYTDYYTDEFKKEYTKIQDTKNKLKCIEKLDGTLVVLGVYNDRLVVTTTSSCNSKTNPYIKKMNKYFNSLDFAEELKDYLIKNNSCFAFEYISPLNKICVDYDKEAYILLDEIDKETFEIKEIKNEFNFERPKIYYYTLAELEEIMKNTENFEGFVVKNDFNHLIKIKTDWWYETSEKFSIFFNKEITKKTVKSILEAYYNNTIDDLYSYQNSKEFFKNLNWVGIIEKEIINIEETADLLSKKYKTTREIANVKNVDSFIISLALMKFKNQKMNEVLFSKIVKYILGKVKDEEDK